MNWADGIEEDRAVSRLVGRSEQQVRRNFSGKIALICTAPRGILIHPRLQTALGRDVFRILVRKVSDRF